MSLAAYMLNSTMFVYTTKATVTLIGICTTVRLTATDSYMYYIMYRVSPTQESNLGSATGNVFYSGCVLLLYCFDHYIMTS